jgi:hypothetical protein
MRARVTSGSVPRESYAIDLAAVSGNASRVFVRHANDFARARVESKQTSY